MDPEGRPLASPCSSPVVGPSQLGAWGPPPSPAEDGIPGVALIGFRGLMLQHGPRSAPPYLRPLKKKGFKEKRATTIGLYDSGKSTTLESNKSLALNRSTACMF
jgi:hypothetical protein